MAANNRLGSIIAQYTVGVSPAISICDDGRHCCIICYADELAYRKIMDEASRCGMRIHRDNIDKFITTLHTPYDVTLQHAPCLYGDGSILAGERIRLFFPDSEIDLLKIRQRYYICTAGSLQGEYIALDSDSLSFTCHGRRYTAQSMAFIVPADAYTVIDYKYLHTYRTVVDNDISEIYKEANAAVAEGALEANFPILLDMCAAAGISIWTLMGMIDHSLINFAQK